jgi:hypothetical protein
MNEIKYDFLFKGDFNENITEAEAVERLAGMFKSDIETASLIIKGNSFFLKTGIDEFLLLQYKKIFEKNHFKTWHRINKKKQTYFINAEGEKLCADCLSKIENSKLCTACTSQETLNNKKDPKDFADSENNKQKEADIQFANYFLKTGITYFIGLFLLDELLVKIWSIDIGIFPYLIGNFIFLLASIPYVENKGYSKIFSILSMLNIFGIAILILLPDKNKTAADPVFVKKNFAAVILLAVSFYWIYGFVGTNNAVEDFDKMNEALRSFNYYHPQKTSDISKTKLEARAQELKNFIEYSFNIIRENDLKPDKVYHISNTLLETLTYFFFTIEYFRYDYLKNRIDPPITLEYYRKIKSLILEKIVEETKKDDLYLIKNVRRAILEWLSNCGKYSYIYNNCEPAEEGIPNKMERYMFDLSRYFWDQNLFPDIKIKNEILNRHPDFVDSITIEENILIIKLKKSQDPEFSEKEIIVGNMFLDKKADYNYTHFFRVIGGTYSIKHFSNNFSIYNDIDSWETLRPIL